MKCTYLVLTMTEFIHFLAIKYKWANNNVNGWLNFYHKVLDLELPIQQLRILEISEGFCIRVKYQNLAKVFEKPYNCWPTFNGSTEFRPSAIWSTYFRQLISAHLLQPTYFGPLRFGPLKFDLLIFGPFISAGSFRPTEVRLFYIPPTFVIVFCICITWKL